MVFSFFKKQPNKMPERPAARPRPVEPQAEAKPLETAAVEAPLKAPAEPLPDLEFSITQPVSSPPITARELPSAPAPSATPEAVADDEFSIEDFDSAFTNSSVMGIDVEHDVDPLQSCVEQVVVLYANGQDVAARSLLETFVRSYRGLEGKRFWMLLFDLLQISGDRAAFEKLGVEYAEACESSPPTWSQAMMANIPVAGGRAVSKVFLQGVLTSESALPVEELARLIAQKADVSVDCAKLIGCDDEIAAQLADLLQQARKQRLALNLLGTEAFMERLNERLIAGEAVHEPAWRLLLELLQRHATQERFEERAVDYAVTFERSPPSWEILQSSGPTMTETERGEGDDAHYLVGELKSCRFEDLPQVLERFSQPILDFSRVTRLDFISAGQLVNRLAPIKASGREIVIRSPNHLVAELMAVVGLNKQARIIVPKS